jgi:hypothetical protein
MNLQNPTQLHLGMKATFLEREYKLLGRVVMGVHDAGEWYFWNEFNLVSDDGAMAILVYEEDEHGLHWRIFTQFDPEFPMTVADAAAVRVGKTLNLNGTDVKVTLVDKSTVKQIEGRAPHGTVMGSVENYFNALGGGLMQVVSWTATKVEYYNGCDLSPEDVAVAFDIPLEKVAVASWRLPRQLHEEQQEEENHYLSGKTFLSIVIAVICIVTVWIVWCVPSAGYEGFQVFKEKAPEPVLFLGETGLLKNEHYQITGHSVMDISEPNLDFERHEYELTADDGHQALLVCGRSPKDGTWEVFTPLQPLEPITPSQAGAMRLGQSVDVEGVQGTIDELFLARSEKIEQLTNSTPLPGSLCYNFSAKGPYRRLLVRWDATGINFFQGVDVPKADVIKGFSSH